MPVVIQRLHQVGGDSVIGTDVGGSAAITSIVQVALNGQAVGQGEGGSVQYRGGAVVLVELNEPDDGEGHQWNQQRCFHGSDAALCAAKAGNPTCHHGSFCIITKRSSRTRSMPSQESIPVSRGCSNPMRYITISPRSPASQIGS